MQILNAEQIRAWDTYTIEHEPITSIDLMERAAAKCVEWIEAQGWSQKQLLFFCGTGNNGGDGLAMARQLLRKSYAVTVFIVKNIREGRPDFRVNLERLQQSSASVIHYIDDADNLPPISNNSIVIDALFGTGLNKPLDGLPAEVVQHINQSGATVVSVDMPSGMFTDKASAGGSIVKADYTLTFQSYKYAFLLQENGIYTGEVVLLNIELSQKYLDTISVDHHLADHEMISKIYKPRNRFSHKGDFGHALIIGGSYGKMGAAVLATKACVKSGAGLTTAFVPEKGYEIMQIAVPEAMVITDEQEEKNKWIHSLPDEIEKYTSVGIGPGLGTDPESITALSFVIRRFDKPLVLDADALNGMAEEKKLLEQLPKGSILTPHPKEFDRMFGSHNNSFERIDTAKKIAVAHQLIIVLKSHHTAVIKPDGTVVFNNTGNAGLAKGGSGDVLTGIITALLAQGYQPADAAILGVYIHGHAADLAAEKLSEEALMARDVIQYLPEAFRELKMKN